MPAELIEVNWLAVIVGAVLAYGLGMLWFSPKMFGERWSAGMNNLQPPASPPVGAMVLQLIGTFALALVVGITATQNMLITAILAVLAVAILQAGTALFKQNAAATATIDAGYTIAIGAIMIIVQGVF